MIQVVSSVMGGYDPIEEWPDQTVDYRRTIWTDVDGPVAIDDHSEAQPFRAPHLHPRMAAKLPKCLPNWFHDSQDVIIWVDGSIRPTSPHFIDWLVSNHRGPISQFRHHDRPTGSIAQEADASVWQGKYKGLNMHRQVLEYHKDGLPTDYGVWATGVIVYDGEGGSWQGLNQFGHEWLIEQTKWGYQDQISQPYCLWRWGVKPHELPGTIIGSEHFTPVPHGSDR
jgi:hypothetical protein